MTKKEKTTKQLVQVKCDKINLLWSEFRIIDPQSNDSLAKYDFSITSDVYKNVILSKLETKIINQPGNSSGASICQSLEFCIRCVLSVKDNPSLEGLENFARMYSLTILWPYAREYASDVFLRSGAPFPYLPVINPQELTKQMDEGKLITVHIHDESFGGNSS